MLMHNYKAGRVLSYLLFVFLLLNHICCNNTRYQPAFTVQNDDLPQQLQPLLDRIVQNGEVYSESRACRGDGSIIYPAQKLFSEFNRTVLMDTILLKKLSMSVHPVVRGFALVTLMNMPGVDKLSIIKQHIHDTAIVSNGETGEKQTILSLLLENSSAWANVQEKRAAEKIVLQEAPYERAAYILVSSDRQLDTFPGCYKQIKKMAEYLLVQPYSAKAIDWFYGIKAVNRLAMYQRKEDVELIKQLLLEEHHDRNPIDVLPLFILKNYPNPAYDTLYMGNGIYPSFLMRYINSTYSRGRAYLDDSVWELIELLVAKKSETSSAMIEKMFIKSPYVFWGYGGKMELEKQEEKFYKQLAVLIRKYECDFYNPIVQKSAKWYKQLKDEEAAEAELAKRSVEIVVEPVALPEPQFPPAPPKGYTLMNWWE
ncbi:MAG: hypothetical protein IT252_08410 [Chitinophagaceae bacterium]|nr:hypothetical protein [Chitinophagaceae bacterium]